METEIVSPVPFLVEDSLLPLFGTPGQTLRQEDRCPFAPETELDA
jgi:hypothetical protein